MLPRRFTAGIVGNQYRKALQQDDSEPMKR